jgi:hypothetical protein
MEVSWHCIEISVLYGCFRKAKVTELKDLKPEP